MTLHRNGLALLALCVSLPAWAQGIPLYQSGTITPHDVAKFATNGLVMKAGGLTGDTNGHGLNPFAITDGGVVALRAMTAAPSVAGYTFDFGHDGSGNALLDIEAVGGATNKGFKVRLNGSTYDWAPNATGNMTGPGSATANGIPVFNGTGGTTLKDSGTGVQLLAGNRAGSGAPWLNTLYEKVPGDIALVQGIWANQTSQFFGISAEFSAASDPPLAGGNVPNAALFTLATNTGGSLNSTLGIIPIAWCKGATTGAKYCNGSNPIALGGDGTHLGAKKLVGEEIDQEFSIGDSATAGSAGLYINTFSVASAGAAIQIGAVSGSWTNGFVLDGIGSTGAGLATNAGAATMAYLVYTGNSSYAQAAFGVGNNNGTGTSFGANQQIIKFLNSGATASVAMALNASDNFLLSNSTTAGNNYYLASGNHLFGSGTFSGLATNATTGFLYIRSMAGAPVGVPTLLPGWSNPVIIDTTNFKICVYFAAWKCSAAMT